MDKMSNLLCHYIVCTLLVEGMEFNASESHIANPSLALVDEIAPREAEKEPTGPVVEITQFCKPP